MSVIPTLAASAGAGFLGLGIMGASSKVPEKISNKMPAALKNSGFFFLCLGRLIQCGLFNLVGDKTQSSQSVPEGRNAIIEKVSMTFTFSLLGYSTIKLAGMICSPIGAAASFVTMPGIVTTSILGGIILKLAGDRYDL